jgi:hypothetical protein
VYKPGGEHSNGAWEALLAGKSGVHSIPILDASYHKTRFAYVKGFDGGTVWHAEARKWILPSFAVAATPAMPGGP